MYRYIDTYIHTYIRTFIFSNYAASAFAVRFLVMRK